VDFEKIVLEQFSAEVRFYLDISGNRWTCKFIEKDVGKSEA
jgi:hypothetical protein